jgi:hypothetical protein
MKLNQVHPLVWIALGGMFLAGCTTHPWSDTVMGSSYQPSNFSRAGARLPSQLRRIAVLPLVSRFSDFTSETGRDQLQPVLAAELAKTRAFELIIVTPEQMRQWTGRPAWTPDEKLPDTFFERLRAALDCDGVLFCQLTLYRPYKPLAIGWHMRLVGISERTTWWTIDEVFDAGNPAVVNAARRYSQNQLQNPPPLADSYSIINSPSRFGQYTLQAAFATLPER